MVPAIWNIPLHPTGATAFQKFTVHLWYNNQAEEAVPLYTSLIETLKRVYEGRSAMPA